MADATYAEELAADVASIKAELADYTDDPRSTAELTAEIADLEAAIAFETAGVEAPEYETPLVPDFS